MITPTHLLQKIYKKKKKEKHWYGWGTPLSNPQMLFQAICFLFVVLALHI
jgi:hypothetical protein